MRKIELATLLADWDTPAARPVRQERISRYMDRPKAELAELAAARELPVVPSREIWYERDGDSVTGGEAGETWFAVYDVPVTIPEDMFDGREDLAESYDDCPRFFTDAGRSAAAVEPNGSSTTPA